MAHDERAGNATEVAWPKAIFAAIMVSMSATQFTTDNQPSAGKSKTRRTLSQTIADLEAEVARKKEEARLLEDGQKYILGGMLLKAARSDAKMRKWTIEQIEKDVTRKADITRIADVLAELKRIQPASVTIEASFTLSSDSATSNGTTAADQVLLLADSETRDEAPSELAMDDTQGDMSTAKTLFPEATI